ncbi:MAG TPA: alpha/beta hydrolase [Mycobacteriales bacterium]|nr:alpha/beta hydrolase [Mycobacteriales bacterium]
MFASLNGTRFFFDVDGAGLVWRDGTQGEQRPTVVMLPGGPGASHMHYKSPQQRFDVFSRVFQVVYVDWRGAGHSEPAPADTLTIAQAVDDVEALREMLGIEKWAVLGASGGGTWALAYTAKYPDRVSHLIAMHCPASADGWGDLAERIARRAGVSDEKALALYRQFVGGDLTAPVEEWAWSVRNTIVQTQQATYIDAEKHPDVVAAHQERWDSLLDAELLASMDVSRWYLRDFARSYPTADDYARIRCPSLVITGETDPVAPPADAQAIATSVPGADVYIHPGGHMPHEDEQVPFLARIAEFFTRHGIEAGAMTALPV